jgi:photosystem II stability/assembly factor-like uncharacterized protein
MFRHVSQVTYGGCASAPRSFYNATVGWAVGDAGRVIHTRDGGETWMPQSTNVTHRLHRVQVIG